MEERPGFLPPEPSGPEPELGASPPPPPQQPPPPPPQQPQAPPPPQPQAPPPPGYGWQQPPQPQAPQPPGWAYAPQPAEPDNGPAVAGFVLSLVSGGLLFVSAGLSSIVSVACAIAGLIYSRKGKQKIARGETRKSGGLAQAGVVISIVSLVLSVLATLFWVLIVVAAITDDEFRDDLEQEFDDSDSISAVLRVAAAVVRLFAG